MLTHLFTCLSEPQRQTRQTQTDKTAPPRDTEKIEKSDATETKDTKLLHEKFLTRKFQCDEFSPMFQMVFSELAPDIKNAPLKKTKITLQTHPYPTSDSQVLHEFPSFFAFCLSKILVAKSFLHEKLLFFEQ